MFAFGAFVPVITAAAERGETFTYSRTELPLHRKQMPTLPWQSSPSGPGKLLLDVELRDATSYYKQSGWYNLSSPEDNQGILFLFDEPAASPIIRSMHYAPMDVLFISPEGKVMEIIPNIVLSALEEDIKPKSPVLAFLFLKGGACQAYSIQPGDELEHKRFKKPPAVIGAEEKNAPGQ